MLEKCPSVEKVATLVQTLTESGLLLSSPTSKTNPQNHHNHNPERVELKACTLSFAWARTSSEGCIVKGMVVLAAAGDAAAAVVECGSTSRDKLLAITAAA